MPHETPRAPCVAQQPSQCLPIHRDKCHSDKSQYQYRTPSARVNKPPHERTRYDGGDTEQCRCQSDSHCITSQVGDEKRKCRQQRMKIHENKEVHQTDSNERACP